MVVKKIELNNEGIQELLKSSELQNISNTYAANAVNKLGAGYAFDTRVGKTRCNADVHATNKRRAREAIDNGTIYKAVF